MTYFQIHFIIACVFSYLNLPTTLNYKQLSAGATFDINFPVFYNATAVADNANMSTGLYFALGSVNLQTLLGDTSRTFTAQKPLYLKRTLNGNIFTVHSDVITTTAPTSADGYFYLRVGQTYSTYQAYITLLENKFYAYQDSAFKVVDPFALKALQDSRGQQIDSTYVKNISSSDGVITVTKGDNSYTTLQGGGSNQFVLDTVPATVDGWLWYELDNGSPVIKFYYAGNPYIVSSKIDIKDPNLTVSPTSLSNTGNISVSYLATGSITVSSSNSSFTTSYDSSTKTITVGYSGARPSTGASTTLTINLSASTGYASASKTVKVSISGTAGGGGVDSY